MRVLVTGAAGFIATHVIKALHGARHDVAGIDRVRLTRATPLQRSRLEASRLMVRGRYRTVDVRDRASVRAAFEAFEPEVVVHLAARAGIRESMQLAAEYEATNVEGTRNVADVCAASDVRRLLFASSSSVYGDGHPGSPSTESSAPGSLRSVYARTKWEAEELLRTAAVPTTVLRFFTVYGPLGRPDMMPWRFASAVLQGEPVTLHEGTSRDFTYVADVARAVRHAAEAQVTPQFECFNVAAGAPASTEGFLHRLADALGSTARVQRSAVPPELSVGTWGSIDRIRSALCWNPRVTIEAGVPLFAAWFRRWSAATPEDELRAESMDEALRS